MCSGMFHRYRRENQAPGTIDEVREIKTWNKEGMPCKKPIEKLTCLNRCRYPVTQTPRKNVWHPGFVFVAELASLSDDHIETCDIYRNLASSSSPSSLRYQTITSKLATSTERSTRANVTCCPSSTRLHQCHQDVPMPRMRQRKAETSNTQCLHLDFTRSITKWDSMCSRSSIQLECASQS